MQFRIVGFMPDSYEASGYEEITRFFNFSHSDWVRICGEKVPELYWNEITEYFSVNHNSTIVRHCC